MTQNLASLVHILLTRPVPVHPKHDEIEEATEKLFADLEAHLKLTKPETAQRTVETLRMLRERKSYTEIQRRLGIGRETARRNMHAALSAISAHPKLLGSAEQIAHFSELRLPTRSHQDLRHIMAQKAKSGPRRKGRPGGR